MAAVLMKGQGSITQHKLIELNVTHKAWLFQMQTLVLLVCMTSLHTCMQLILEVIKVRETYGATESSEGNHC